MSDFNKVVFDRLPNGIRVYSQANDVLNTMMIGIHRGTRDDPQEFEGAHHLIEHMVCGCSKTIPGRLVCRTNRRYLGGSDGPEISVFTVASHTGYGTDDLFSRKALETVFPIYAALLRDNIREMHAARSVSDAIFNEDIFTLERAAVGNETTGNNDVPMMRAFKTALPLLYQKNPAGRFGDANLDQLEAIDLDHFRKMVRSSYAPENMSVILIGPKQHEAMRFIKKAGLHTLPDCGRMLESVYDHSDDVPILEGIRERVIEKRDLEMHYVTMLWPTEVFLQENWLALEIMAGMLKDRVEEELRDKNRVLRGGVYHPSVTWDSSSSHGYIEVSFSTRGSWDHFQDLIGRVLQVCERLKVDVSPFLREDIKDNREYESDSFLAMYRYVSGTMADRILKHVANGDPELVQFELYRKGILQVTPDQIRRVAAKYLTIDRFAKVIVKPVS